MMVTLSDLCVILGPLCAPVSFQMSPYTGNKHFPDVVSFSIGQFGITLKLFWGHFGVTLGSLLAYEGAFASLWGHFEIIV